MVVCAGCGWSPWHCGGRIAGDCYTHGQVHGTLPAKTPAPRPVPPKITNRLRRRHVAPDRVTCSEWHPARPGVGWAADRCDCPRCFWADSPDLRSSKCTEDAWHRWRAGTAAPPGHASAQPYKRLKDTLLQLPNAEIGLGPR